jgi:hypothetical protein
MNIEVSQEEVYALRDVLGDALMMHTCSPRTEEHLLNILDQLDKLI